MNARRPRSRTKIWIGTIVAVVAIGLVALTIRAVNSAAGADEELLTATAERGDLTISLTFSGAIQNRENVVVRSRVPGHRSILWIVDEGSHVKEGDLLVELDFNDLEERRKNHDINVKNAENSLLDGKENLEVVRLEVENEVARADLDKKLARLDLERFQEETFPRQLEEGRTRITLADEELSRAEEKLEWSRKLAAEGYVTRSELKADELRAKRAKIDLGLAEAGLRTLETYTQKRQLEELKARVDLTVRTYERAERRHKLRLQSARNSVESRQRNYDRHLRQLKETEEHIANCRITAPIDGLVVYATTGHRWNREPLQEGQSVRERQHLISLPTATALMAEVKLHESSLQKVEPGMPALVRVDAFPGSVYTGRVETIGLLPDAQSAWINSSLKVYNTKVFIDGEPKELRPGMTCRVEILLDELRDAVYVPLQSVTKVRGRNYVYFPGDGEPVRREVTVGADNLRVIHITSGLDGGEAVLLAPPLAAEEKRERPEKEAPGDQDPGEKKTPKKRKRAGNGRRGR